MPFCDRKKNTFLCVICFYKTFLVFIKHQMILKNATLFWKTPKYVCKKHQRWFLAFFIKHFFFQCIQYYSLGLYNVMRCCMLIHPFPKEKQFFGRCISVENICISVFPQILDHRPIYQNLQDVRVSDPCGTREKEQIKARELKSHLFWIRVYIIYWLYYKHCSLS